MNAIWIFGDQHPAHALSCNGNVNLQTPEIDRLAAEGVNFTRAVSGSPLCCPFRGSLITSLYPHECVPGHQDPMPQNVPTVANAFAAEGYETAYFGKWHLDGFKENFDRRGAMHIIPRERRGGFDTWIGYENNNSQWDCWVHGHMEDGSNVEHHLLPGYESDCLTDYMIDFLKQRDSKQNKPFFAVLSVQPPHNPNVAPPEYMEKHKPEDLKLRPNVPNIPGVLERTRRDLSGAYAQIENLDWNVGRIRKALEETGLDKDTVILFFSDHGDMHGSHGQHYKTCPWEESVRVPFIISGPARLTQQGGRKSDAVINHVDIAPTTLGLCGLTVPTWMRGYDYSPIYLDDREQLPEMPDSAFLQIVVPTCHADSTDRAWRGIVTTDGWKYVVLEHQPWLMFNLNDDPYELANMAHNTRYKVERKRLHDRLVQWIRETGDTFTMPEI
ncbi:MAG: sulfatase [Kiritimatiellaceae bacterium]|nr:sulfatase [Kiritimatiellaceae bacterium]